jgi:large subunit ribosomal protein L31e
MVKRRDPKGRKDKARTRSTLNEVITLLYTINLHRKIYVIGFKKRAPRAMKENE